MKLLHETAPLKYVTINIPGELIRTPRVHRYILVITDRFTKLFNSIPMEGVSALEVSKLFVENCVLNCGPTTELLSDNGSQFMSEFLMEVRHILRKKRVHNNIQ